jgi:phosphatidylglycerophosphate synthase
VKIVNFLKLLINNPVEIDFIKRIFTIDPKRKWLKNQIANLVTLSRFLFIVLLFYFFWILEPTTRIYFFAFMPAIYCWISDFFDGLYAKTNKTQTQFGAWFDRIVDKLFDLVFFKVVYLFSPVLAWINVLAEFILLVLSLVEMKFNVSVKSGLWGKMKFAVRAATYWIFFLPILFSGSGIPGHPIASKFGIFFFGASIVLGGMSIAFHSMKIFEKIKKST